MRKQILAVTLLVLALRLPFLNQAIQGDDVYYLYGAQHAQIDPLHPNHARYVFLGDMVDMRGHPHPPLNAWFLGAVLALAGDIREPAFHAAYILFSLIAAFSALALARRFTTRPLAATLLFLVTPTFVVNGNSLESDLPFVAFWLASIALFVYAVDRRSLPWLAASCAAMAFAALAAYQSIVMVPILLLYGRKWRPSWIAAFTAPALLIAWQLWERSTTGAMPATVLAGYMQSYGLQALAQKVKSAMALTGHLGWLVFPILTLLAFRRRWWILLAGIPFAFVDANPLFWLSVGVGVLVLAAACERWREFPAAWLLLFFASALVLFFAGSARYLLPIALPVAILVARELPSRWLYAGAACELVLSVGLAIVNYQHWDGYRTFARSLAHQMETRRVWVNGEWGLRYYLESEGALPLLRGQALHPGELVVSSSLAFPVAVSGGGGILAPLSASETRPSIPLRIAGLGAKSGYSTTLFGLRPFDVSAGPIDRLRAEVFSEREPRLEDVPMNAPQASEQIVSGIYDLEDGQWRWMSAKAVLLLKSPAQPKRLTVRLVIPDAAPGRTVTVSLDGKQVLQETFPKSGAYTLTSAALRPEGSSAIASIAIDKTFSVPGDRRELGAILAQVGFR
ncbi:MAG: glycosyltransferase family 39 protein [Acidobacteriota bacterium]|nr:glycosyltransferase family 39 protein [Acidobacteriota bacterium]